MGIDAILARIGAENLPKPEVPTSFRRFFELKKFATYYLYFSIMLLVVAVYFMSLKGVAVYLLLTGTGAYNYMFNPDLFYILAAVETLLLILVVLVHRKKYVQTYSSGGGRYYRSGRHVIYEGSQDSGSDGSDMSDFSGGGGESGGGGATEDW